MADSNWFKQLSRRSLSIISYYAGFCWAKKILGSANVARILCYHGISDNPNSHFAVNVVDFFDQIEYLKHNFSIVSISDLVQLIERGKRVPEKTLAISIDDGFEDFYLNGYPVLRKFDVPATIFVPTGFVDNATNKINKRKLPQDKFLSWDQIREIHHSNIEIGSHTVNHVSLSNLSLAEVRYELKESKRRLEEELEEPIKGFAYPYGTFRDISPEAEKVITDSGYSWAVTSISGVNNRETDPFGLKRIMVDGDDGKNGVIRSAQGALDGWVVAQKFGYYLKKVTARGEYTHD
jgi:peptidoglycan/xylan/chitin deacetylase (PgdA/CDA1 family)